MFASFGSFEARKVKASFQVPTKKIPRFFFHARHRKPARVGEARSCIPFNASVAPVLEDHQDRKEATTTGKTEGEPNVRKRKVGVEECQSMT
jgi:hypothetical protein